MNAFLFAFRNALSAARSSWRAARGNPNISYRFEVGDRVRAIDMIAGGIVIRRCWSDETYDLSDGSSCPGYALRKVTEA
jgi:hypothetical protein